MNDTFNSFTAEQVESYFKRMHGMVHWLLLYKESHYCYLDKYIDTVQSHIRGLGSLFKDSPEILELAVVIEELRLENNKGDECDYNTYRKLVFDAHAIIDRIVHKKEVLNV